MQRTTLALEDEIVKELKARSVRERASIAKVANNLLRKAIKAEKSSKATLFKFDWKPHSSGKPKVDVTDRDALYEAMEDR